MLFEKCKNKMQNLTQVIVLLCIAQLLISAELWFIINYIVNKKVWVWYL